jgi:hypothetical protein
MSKEHVARLNANHDINTVCKAKIFESAWKLEAMVEELRDNKKQVSECFDDLLYWIQTIKTYSDKVQL